MSLWKIFLQPISIRRLALTSGGYFRNEDNTGYLLLEDAYRIITENSTFGPLIAAQTLAATPVTTGFQPFSP
jgi:hypothetical protein